MEWLTEDMEWLSEDVKWITEDMERHIAEEYPYRGSLRIWSGSLRRCTRRCSLSACTLYSSGSLSTVYGTSY